MQSIYCMDAVGRKKSIVYGRCAGRNRFKTVWPRGRYRPTLREMFEWDPAASSAKQVQLNVRVSEGRNEWATFWSKLDEASKIKTDVEGTVRCCGPDMIAISGRACTDTVAC